jgi:ribonuclease T2
LRYYKHHVLLEMFPNISVGAGLSAAGLRFSQTSAQLRGRYSGQLRLLPAHIVVGAGVLRYARSSASSSECDPQRHFGFVVHGLWPENEDGSYPQHCAPAQPVAQATVQHMLPIMPDRGLIQHEWATHGTCSGLDTQTYFSDIDQAFHEVQMPQDYRAPASVVSANPADIEQKFADANHAPRGAFRVSCSNAEFVAIEACLTKDMQYRQCGSSLRDCRVPQVTVRPTK